MEDERIIALFFERDERAIECTHEKYGRRLYSISYSVLKSPQDSEETLNDTYDRVWNKIPPEKPVYFFAYLGRITKNLAINLYNKNRSRKRAGIMEELNDMTPSVHSGEDEIATAELTRIINDWLDTLEKEDRVLFVKRYWFGDSVKSLATVFNERENYVAVRLHRLRKKLRALLEREGVCV